MKPHLGIPVFLLLFLPFISAGQTFTGKPIYDITTKRNGTPIGTIRVELFPKIAPLHVRNFDSLVRTHFFDSTAFHRVIPGFMIQGGDPNSRHGDKSTWGQGDPSQPTVNAEFSVVKHVRGILSAARSSDTNSATSQFFICVASASWLNGLYSVYGHVTDHMEIVDSVVNSPRDVNDNPLEKIEMFITYVGSNDTVPEAPVLNLPASGTQNVGTSRLLKWNTVPDAIYYQLELATDGDFNNIILSKNVANTSISVGGLKTATNYYWRVRTNNGGNLSPYSERWTFSTTGSTGISVLNSVTEESLIFPNPSDGNIQFKNLNPGNTLLIFDASGRLVFQEKINQVNPHFDFSSWSKGIYIYAVQLNNGISHGKFIIE